MIIAITMMVGRVWCNWMVPLYSTSFTTSALGWMGSRRNFTKQMMIESNRYRKIYAIKYYILAVMIAMAAPPGSFPQSSTRTQVRSCRAYRGAELKQTGVSRMVAAVEIDICRASPTQGAGGQNSSRWLPGLVDPDRPHGSLDDHRRAADRAQGDRKRPTPSPASTGGNPAGRRARVHRSFWWLTGGSPGSSAASSVPGCHSWGSSSQFAIWRIDRDPVTLAPILFFA